MREDLRRNEANRKEEEGRMLLERTFRDARRMEDDAAMDENKYRDTANAMCERVEQRRDAIRDAVNVMMATVTRNTASMRVHAAYVWDENKAEVKELRQDREDGVEKVRGAGGEEESTASSDTSKF